MFPNILPSDRQTLAAVINPQSAGAGTVTSGWVAMKDYDQIQALILTGTLGTSATVDAKLQQATDSSGTGAKDVTGKAITQLVKATDDNKQAIINCRSDELDVANAFAFVQLSITVGTAASEVAGVVLGTDARYQPMTAAATVVQTI